MKYPIYNVDTPHMPGMYLGLFHGRKTPTESLNDWGSNGPLIGPLNWCHTTYFGHIRVQFSDEAGFSYRDKYGFTNSEPDIAMVKDGLIEFDGVFYGDWTVFHHKGDTNAKQ